MARISRNPRKKNPTIEEDTSNLPSEIIENILSRLPVKSLLRFKSVSKRWCSLISDAKFARFHLNQTKKLCYKTLSVILYSRSLKFTFLKLTNQNLQLESLEFPLKKYRQADVLCSCDGLVLLKNIYSSRDKMCVLWNPSARTYTKFSCQYSFRDVSRVGLCYDALNDDYKVVLVISDTWYAVFSCKNNSWIEKDDYSFGRMLGPGLFVNGALHWVAEGYRKDSDSKFKGIQLQQLYRTDSGHTDYMNGFVYECNYYRTYEICCFDPRDDKFKKLSSPECFDISSVFGLTDLGGQLCLYLNTYDRKMIEIYIWAMKEYGDCNSWTKLLTIDNLPVPHNCFNVKVMCLTNESNIVLHIHGSGIVVYNPKEKKLCKIHELGEEYLNRRGDIVVNPLLCWNDSLVLPNNNNINWTKRKQHGH